MNDSLMVYYHHDQGVKIPSMLIFLISLSAKCVKYNKIKDYSLILLSRWSGKLTGGAYPVLRLSSVNTKNRLYDQYYWESEPGIRKYTKTKSVFPHDQAAMKSVYLAISNIERKWKYPIRDWGMILQQFLIKFEDRCRIWI